MVNRQNIAEPSSQASKGNQSGQTDAERAADDADLDDALDDTFPASDPPSITQPHPSRRNV